LAKASEHHHALAAAFVLRLTTAPLVLLALLLLRQPLRIPPCNLRWLVLVGVLDSGANTLYALATDHGLLSLVSVLGSLYPLTTVLLAQALSARARLQAPEGGDRRRARGRRADLGKLAPPVSDTESCQGYS